MDPIRNFLTTFIVVFFAVALALTYFGFAAFYNLDLVGKVSFAVAIIYTVCALLSTLADNVFKSDKSEE